jgi:transcription-repair coupling factor (superfamily II helicase)
MTTGTKTAPPLQEWLESESWQAWQSIGLTGLKGSSKAYLLALWQEKITGPFLIIVPRLQDAESLLEDLHFFQKNEKIPSLLFPPWETLPYDKIPPHPEIIQERI